jgi:hypothetical protein
MGCACSSPREEKKWIQKFSEKAPLEIAHLETDQGGEWNMTLNGS